MKIDFITDYKTHATMHVNGIELRIPFETFFKLKGLHIPEKNSIT